MTIEQNAQDSHSRILGKITIEPLSRERFERFGDVLDTNHHEPVSINRGMCKRFNDIADLDHCPSGRLGISLFKSRIRNLPYDLEMVERHPFGPQCFFPLDGKPFLVIVAPDHDGKAGIPRAFVTFPFQGINFRRGTWHGVLTPMDGRGVFAVVDWIGDINNVEEHWYTNSWMVAK